MIVKLERIEVQSRKDMEMIDITPEVDRVVSQSQEECLAPIMGGNAARLLSAAEGAKTSPACAEETA